MIIIWNRRLRAVFMVGWIVFWVLFFASFYVFQVYKNVQLVPELAAVRAHLRNLHVAADREDRDGFLKERARLRETYSEYRAKARLCALDNGVTTISEEPLMAWTLWTEDLPPGGWRKIVQKVRAAELTCERELAERLEIGSLLAKLFPALLPEGWGVAMELKSAGF